MVPVGSHKLRSFTKAKAPKKGPSSKGKENKAISLSNGSLQKGLTITIQYVCVGIVPYSKASYCIR